MSTKLLTGQVAVESLDLWPLLMSTVRYAMGRRSTAPSMAIECVQRYARHLEPEQLAQIASEIRQERYLGDECDVRAWIGLAEWIENRRECRSCAGFGYLKRDGPQLERCDECDGTGAVSRCPECRCANGHTMDCSRARKATP